MAEFPMASEIVFPTFNDVAPTLNRGRRWSEQSVRDWITKFSVDFVDNGFTTPSSSADLDIDVAAGVLLVEGYFVEETVATTVTAIDNSTSFIFLRLLKSSDLVTEAVLAVEASATPTGPEDILLTELIASGGVITSATDISNRNQFGVTFEALAFSARG